MDERIESLIGEVAANEGELRVRATSDGEWRRWVDAHPPRVEGETGYRRDVDVAGGYCNADALIDDLGLWASSWDGEPLSDGDWANVLAPSIDGARLAKVATSIVEMHVIAVDFTQVRTGLSASLNRLRVSVSPEISE